MPIPGIRALWYLISMLDSLINLLIALTLLISHRSLKTGFVIEPGALIAQVNLCHGLFEYLYVFSDTILITFLLF